MQLNYDILILYVKMFKNLDMELLWKCLQLLRGCLKN